MNPGKLSELYTIYTRTLSQDSLGERVYTYTEGAGVFGTPLGDGSEDKGDNLGGNRVERLTDITLRTEALDSFEIGDQLEDRFGRRWVVRVKKLGVRYSTVTLYLFNE